MRSPGRRHVREPPAANAGPALIAGKEVRRKIVALAARTLGVPEDDIVLDDGEAIARGGNRPRLSFGELARLAQGYAGVSFAPGRRRASSTPPISRRRRPPIATAPMSPKSRSIR